MSKYLFLYRSAPSDAVPSPEEMQQILAAWGQWIGKFTATGNMLEGGDGLQPTGKLLRAGGIVTDGPFMESKEVVGGYSIVQADHYDQAIAIAKECPIFHGGGWVEIRELAGLN